MSRYTPASRAASISDIRAGEVGVVGVTGVEAVSSPGKDVGGQFEAVVAVGRRQGQV